MKVLVVYSHPNPKSFNAAILGTVKDELGKAGAEVKVKDLYAMNWNPVLSGSDFEQFSSGKLPSDIAREQADVSWADLLIFISPIWWYTVTAMLKGYVDRVMGHGFAYEYTETGPRGKLTDKRALLITTSGADEKTARETGMLDALNTTLVQGIFNFCGFKEAKCKNCFAVPFVSDDDRRRMLEEIREFVRNNIFARQNV